MQSKIMPVLILFLVFSVCGFAAENTDIVKFVFPAVIRPLTIHKEVTAVFDDLNWGRHATSLTCEVITWELPKADEKNATILKYLEANRKDLQVFVGGEMGGKNIKALGAIPNLLGQISPNIRIKGTIEAWAYESPTINHGRVSVRLIGIDRIGKE